MTWPVRSQCSELRMTSESKCHDSYLNLNQRLSTYVLSHHDSYPSGLVLKASLSLSPLSLSLSFSVCLSLSLSLSSFSFSLSPRLRLRVKSLQNVIDSQNERMASMAAVKELAALGHPDESTGQGECSVGVCARCHHLFRLSFPLPLSLQW